MRSNLVIVIAMAAIVAVVVAVLPGADSPLREVGELTHPSLAEASALLKSRQRDGVFWTLNDSGNPPRLFAVERTGKLLTEYNVKGIANIDWEALAQDQAGNLYIGDVGNNLPFLTLDKRRIHRLREPDPAKEKPVPEGKPLPVLSVEKSWAYTFPDKPFDVEGMFFWKGDVYLVSKVAQTPTKLYRMRLDQDADKPVKLVEVCELTGIHRVTDASLSPDSQRLALCTYDRVVIFERKPDEPWEALKDRNPKLIEFGKSTAIEGCCWNGDEILLVSESRAVYALKYK